jgi:aspartyl/asparaginyl beta-hydroxylase
MYFDGAFRYIGAIDPKPLVSAVESFGEDAWFEYARRQETFAPHRHTQTIPLLYDEDARHSEPTAWPRFAQLEPVLKPALEKIREASLPAESGDPGYFIRIILTRLSPHCWISRHQDGGDSLVRSHRYHLALTTDRLVEFEVDEQVQHFAAGDIWEINNRKYHAVRNNSDQPRIHMIFDYVVPGERIEDPDGVYVA